MNVTDRAEPAEAGPPHPVRRVSGWLLSLVLIVAGVGAIAVGVIPPMTGASAYNVLSGSMEPTLPVGSVVVVRPQPADQIKPGDVITYTDRDPASLATRVVTHRVVAVEQGPGGLSFRTRGDANDTPDLRAIAAGDVHGVLWYSLPVAGWVRNFLVSPAGLLYTAGVALLVLAGHLALPKTRRPAR